MLKKRVCDDCDCEEKIYEPDTVYYDIEARLFHLHGNITDKMSLIFLNAINKMNSSIDISPIKVDINSSGGNLDTITSIVSTIKTSEAPIHTHISGNAFSAGAIAFLAGTNRTVSPVSTLMFHYPIYSTENSAYKILESAITTMEVYERIMTYLLEGTKLDVTELVRIIKINDWFVSPEKALELGLANAIKG